jgi:hypothetical protein
VENAGIMKKKISEDDWEIEECHFAVSAVHFSASSLLAYFTASTTVISHTREYITISSVSSTLIHFAPQTDGRSSQIAISSS